MATTTMMPRPSQSFVPVDDLSRVRQTAVSLRDYLAAERDRLQRTMHMHGHPDLMSRATGSNSIDRAIAQVDRMMHAIDEIESVRTCGISSRYSCSPSASIPEIAIPQVVAAGVHR